MKDLDLRFLLGVVVGFFLTAVASLVVNSQDDSIRSIYNSAKTECEISLPRNEECVINFIPKGNSK